VQLWSFSLLLSFPLRSNPLYLYLPLLQYDYISKGKSKVDLSVLHRDLDSSSCLSSPSTIFWSYIHQLCGIFLKYYCKTIQETYIRWFLLLLSLWRCYYLFDITLLVQSQKPLGWSFHPIKCYGIWYQNAKFASHTHDGDKQFHEPLQPIYYIFFHSLNVYFHLLKI